MTTKQGTSTKDDFHRERSRFLDAYARLEEAIAKSPQSTREKRLAGTLKSLATVRNDLVHSHMRFAQLEGELQAVVVNTKVAETAARPARLVRLQDFKQLEAQVEEAARKLQQ